MPVIGKGNPQGGHHEHGGGGPGYQTFNHGAVIFQGAGKHPARNFIAVVFGLKGVADNKTGGILIGGQGIGKGRGRQAGKYDAPAAAGKAKKTLHHNGHGPDMIQRSDKNEHHKGNNDGFAEGVQATATDQHAHILRDRRHPNGHIRLKALVQALDQAVRAVILKKESQHSSGKDRQKQNGDGGLFTKGTIKNDGRRQQQQGIKVKHGAQGDQKRFQAFQGGAGNPGRIDKAQREKRPGGQQGRRQRGVHHGADMIEQGNVAGQGGQIGGIGKGRHFIAKIGPADNGSGGDTHVRPQRPGNARKHHADGSRRSPGGARQAGKDNRADKGQNIEIRRIDNPEAVVDQHGNGPRYHPTGDNQSDGKKNKKSRQGPGQFFYDGGLDFRPLVAQYKQQGHGKNGSGNKYDFQGNGRLPLPMGADQQTVYDKQGEKKHGKQGMAERDFVFHGHSRL